MDREGFRQLLRERNVPEDQFEGRIALAERFEAFSSEPATPGDVRAFAGILLEEGLNTWDNLVTLVRYAHFTKNVPAYVAAVELLDGSEALEGLHEKLGRAVGEQLRGAGFHKKSWDVIYGQELEAEIVQTVLKGDPWCKIAIRLPEEALPED
ncbi:MAG: hypothetical protein M8467_18990 [Anaerolineae bacterium]|nr:hypothetical protein [Anaerolineae bacterium]